MTMNDGMEIKDIKRPAMKKLLASLQDKLGYGFDDPDEEAPARLGSYDKKGWLPSCEDEAIVGVTVSGGNTRFVYSEDKLIEAYAKEAMKHDPNLEQDDAYEQARDHYEYNTIGALAADEGDFPIVVKLESQDGPNASK